MVRVPFDVEMAKKITNGEIEGRILTRNGESVRLLSFDRKDEYRPVIALVNNGSMEIVCALGIDGKYAMGDTIGKRDLFIEIPEYMTFKDGDVIAFGHTEKSIAIGIFHRNKNYKSHECYVKLDWSGGLVYDVDPLTYNNARFATEEEKQKLIDSLKESKDPEAKECLKMLGIEIKPKCEFRPKDWVLCYSDGWNLCQFSHTKLRDIDNKLMYVTVGGIAYEQCIPYNDQTAHLLGTDKDWEEEK